MESISLLFSVISAAIFFISFVDSNAGLYLLITSILLSPEMKLFELPDRTVAIRISDIVIILVFLGWLGRMALRKIPENFKNSPLNSPILIFSWVMIFSTLLGIFIGTISPLKSSFFLLKRLQYFFIFFIALNNIKTLKQVKILVVMILLSTVIINIVTYYQRSQGMLVAYGTFGKETQAAVLAGFFLIALFLAIGMMMVYKWQIKILLLLVIVSTMLAILFVNARSSYVAFLISIIITGLLTKRFKLILVSSSAIILFLLNLNFLPADLSRSVYTAINIFPGKLDPSWVDRLAAWRIYLPQIFDYSLFFGKGMSFVPLGYIDNQYIMELLTTGVAGLLCLLWLFWRIFITSYSMYKNTNNLYVRGITFGFLGSFIALLIQAMAVTNFYTIRTMEPFWLILGSIMVLRNLEIDKTESPQHNHPNKF